MTTNAPVGRPELLLQAMNRGEDDLERFRACFARNSDRPRSAASLRWQYLENTTPELFVDLAAEAASSERLAAIYASLPGWVTIGGARRLALQSLDTLTDADHRGRGLFVQLAKRTFERAERAGCALIYGFPNGNSAHGFFTKLGWTKLDPVPFLVRPLRARYVLDRVKRLRSLSAFVPDVALALPPRGPLRGHELAELRSFDHRVTELWRDFSRDVGVALDRDAAYFDWRITKKPEESYVTLTLDRAGRHEALVTFAVKEKHGGRIGYVMELLHRPGSGDAGRRLLSIALWRMAQAGADAILAWNFAHSPNHSAYVRNGFVPLPERLRPIELHFGARVFDASLASVVTNRSSWYLSYLDSDTV